MFRLTFFAVLVLFSQSFAKAAQDTSFSVIPLPAHIAAGTGSFMLNVKTPIVLDKGAAAFRSEARYLQDMLSHSLGGSPFLSTGSLTSGSIHVSYDPTIQAVEGYQLDISPVGIRLAASKPAGLFMAIETLRQLLPASAEIASSHPTSYQLASVQIKDEPAYAWRGMMLDVSRHFFSVAYVKKFIDRMALYKFNKLHLHLTDDQGWRIEIKKYPKLTEEGAWRTNNNQDSACLKKAADNPDFKIDSQHLVNKQGKILYGGFYSQQQMKELIAYAAVRHIEIIPEIDMPGHMMAAINAYPYLTCGTSGGWGKNFSVPICPANPSVYTFAENVLSEIAALFPSVYIHLGGDEVEMSSWETSAECQALMKKEGLKNVHELQSYFIHKMQNFLRSKGKKLIGWDEILQGGINSSPTVMYWRSWVPDAPKKALLNGNELIMSPVNTLYFDAVPDQHSVENVYRVNLRPDSITDVQAKKLLGGQANLWSEMIPSEKRLDFLSMPRMVALSEALWSKQKPYADFLRRLAVHYPRMDALGIHYRMPDIPNLLENQVYIEHTFLKPEQTLPGFTIRYTTDLTPPTVRSAALTKPFRIDHDVTVKLAVFSDYGNVGDVRTIVFKKESYSEPVHPENTQPGLVCSYFGGSYSKIGDIKAHPDSSTIVQQVVVPKLTAQAFGLKYSGYIKVPTTGIYSFFLIADDGAIFRIGDKLVVDNDGSHFAIEKSGQIALRQGLHPFALDFIEGGGGYKLSLLYSLNGSTPQEIPQSWLLSSITKLIY